MVDKMFVVALYTQTVLDLKTIAFGGGAVRGYFIFGESDLNVNSYSVI